MNLFRRREKKDNVNKTADRLFLQSFILSIVGALLGIMALSTSTWAWFASSINSNTSTIEIGYCEMNIGITENHNGGIATVSDIMIDSEDALKKVEDSGYYKELKADTSYIINLVPEGTSKTCYCRININGDDYLTEQISVADSESFVIELLPKVDAYVEVYLRWGTGIEPNRDFESGFSYIITEDGVVCSDDYEEEETDEADSQDDEASTEAETYPPETTTPDTEVNESEISGDGQEETVVVPTETDDPRDDESTQEVIPPETQEDTSFEGEPKDDVSEDYVETDDEMTEVEETTDESLLDS